MCSTFESPNAMLMLSRYIFVAHVIDASDLVLSVLHRSVGVRQGTALYDTEVQQGAHREDHCMVS